MSPVTKPNQEAPNMSLLELLRTVDDFCKAIDET
jgi:hypothetical protein